MDNCGHSSPATRTVPTSDEARRLRCCPSNESARSRPTGPECSGGLSRSPPFSKFGERSARATSATATRARRSGSLMANFSHLGIFAKGTGRPPEHIARVTDFRLQAAALARDRTEPAGGGRVRSVAPRGNGFSVGLFAAVRVNESVGRGGAHFRGRAGVCACACSPTRDRSPPPRLTKKVTCRCQALRRLSTPRMTFGNETGGVLCLSCMGKSIRVFAQNGEKKMSSVRSCRGRTGRRPRARTRRLGVSRRVVRTRRRPRPAAVLR
jgi:hypothetical protein